MSSFTIEGILKLTSPLHIASPGKRYVDLETLRISTERGTPITPTTQYPVALTEDDYLSTDFAAEGRSHRSFEVPVFPANDMRGRLRRIAAEDVFEALKGRGETISLEVYHGMTCGAVTGQPAKGLTFEVATKSGVHPFLGLFGGGPRLVRSALQVSPLWPITQKTIKAGLVPERYDSEKVGTDWLTRAIFYRRVDDALEFYNGNASLIINGYSDAIAQWIKDVARQKRDGEKEASRSSKQIRTFAALEYVIAGTRFYLDLRIDTSRTKLGALGLLVHAINGLANKQAIGGWVRNGFGRFESDLFLVPPDGGRIPVLINQGGRYTPNAVGIIADALDAWAEAEVNINSAELDELYSLPNVKATTAEAEGS